ncbi:hypothetical protein, partial [Lactiplantibacillus plajomi]
GKTLSIAFKSHLKSKSQKRTQFVNELDSQISPHQHRLTKSLYFTKASVNRLHFWYSGIARNYFMGAK